MIEAMAEIDQLFARRVRRELADHGMTQSELAESTGIHPAVLGKIINGQRPASLAQFTSIAFEFGFDLRERVGDELRQQLSEATASLEQALAAKLAAEHEREVQLAVSRRIEAEAAVKCAELEGRATRAERIAAKAGHDRAAAIAARRRTEAEAATKCARLEQRLAEAEAKCARLERAERERAAKEREADEPINTDRGSRHERTTRSWTLESLDDPYALPRQQANLMGKALGNVVEIGVRMVAFHRMVKRPRRP